MSEEIKKQNLNPGFFFLSLGVVVTLIASVASLLGLLFETLNKRLPDVLNSTYQYGYNSYSYESVRTTLATLIIVFPVFLLLTYFWRKMVKKGLAGWDKTIFKWMIYLILFLSAIVIIVDLVTLVNYFVSGEITNRFIYKVLGTLLVAGLVGVYYFRTLRDFSGKKIGKSEALSYLILSILFVGGAITFAFLVIGSPKNQRAMRLDERRVNDLQTIQWQVINYYQQKEKLPADLASLKDPISSFALPRDPEFQQGKTYEYLPKEGLTFDLCATFSTDRVEGWIENTPSSPIPYASDMAVKEIPAVYPGSASNDSWNYKEGRNCFERTIDPEIYKPFKNNK